ncbi:unnamed protein product [Candidula unifasciata]|uniref:Glycosyltransferase family 92 protein n=1 Tax=Candidula unifasciata TaxID=100452 RepID=A0A8S3Z2X4_9EUPU|nr:unnamed protein product [Candidula unifasciata]
MNLFRCKCYKGLLHRKIVSLVLFSYFVMIFLFLLNLDIIQSNSQSVDSTKGVASDSIPVRGNSLKKETSLLALLKQLALSHKTVLQRPKNNTKNFESDQKFIKPTTGNVTHVDPVPLRNPILDLKHEKAGDFIVIGEEAFVYSAFIDDRKIPSFVRIMTLLSQTASNQPMYCLFSETAAVQPLQMVRYELCENHNRKFGGYIYSCRVPDFVDSRTLEFVTIFFTKSGSNVSLPLLPVRPPGHKAAQLDLFPNRTHANDSIQIEKNYRTSMELASNVSSKNLDEQTKTFTFAICISPLFGNISVHRLVEFIELSRLLGTQHFIFYNHSLTLEISDVLEYYISKNLASVLPWTLPPEMHTDTSSMFVWYFGQLLAHNDCLYRAMPRFDLVAFNDIDEFIVPHSNAKYWRDVFPSMLTDDRCGFSLQSAYYDPGSRDTFTRDLLTPILVEKTKVYSTVRRKVMLCPWRVFEVGIHHISKQNREEWLPLQVDPEVAYLHHYRSCLGDYGMSCSHKVNDTIISDRYLKDLTINFNRVLADIGSSQNVLGLASKNIT